MYYKKRYGRRAFSKRRRGKKSRGYRVSRGGIRL